jgi:hypothetical protein
MSILSKYFDEHKEVLLRDNPGRNKSWLANEHIRQFIGWLKKLAHDPIFTVMTYQEYDINRYMFYTEQQGKKSTSE